MAQEEQAKRLNQLIEDAKRQQEQIKALEKEKEE